MQALRCLVLLAPILLAGATSADADDANDAKTYADCLSMVERSPDKAVDFAAAWERKGGGTPAQHCRALGLIAQGYPEDGALELERAAIVLPGEQASLAAELLGQAAQAWIKVDNLDRALLDQNQALSLDPKNAGLLVDRAVVYGLRAKYGEAVDDLNKAHALSPDDAEVLAYRAAAYRRLDRFDLAEGDVTQALALSPGMPLALLERGYLRKKQGDIAGARKDWLAVAVAVPDSAMAAEAQANLEQIDLNAN